MKARIWITAATLALPALVTAQSSVLDDGRFQWHCGPPIQSAVVRSNDPCYPVKDPITV